MNNNYLEILMQMHESNSWIFYAIVFMFGSAMATFLNVLLYRMPVIMEHDIVENVKFYLKEKKIAHDPIECGADKYNTLMGRSYCTTCGTMIPFYYNIPVLGWLLLRGKSGCCKQPIPIRYFLVEFLFSAFACAAFAMFGFYQALGIVFFSYLAIAISDIDIKTKMIPDEYTYLLLWLGVIFNYNGTYTSLESSVSGVIVAYSFLYVINYLYCCIRNTDGMGGGDFKLLAAIVAWTGLSSTLNVVALSCLFGILTFLFKGLIAKGYKLEKEAEIPFAPALLLAGFTCLVI